MAHKGVSTQTTDLAGQTRRSGPSGWARGALFLLLLPLLVGARFRSEPCRGTIGLDASKGIATIRENKTGRTGQFEAGAQAIQTMKEGDGVIVGASVCARHLAPALTGADQPKVRYVGRWDRQRSGVFDDLHAVFFLDAQHGWAAGAANTILRTMDGGATWSPLLDRDPTGQAFDTIVFSSLTEGWASTADNLLHTTDSGKTWQPSSKLPTQVSDSFTGGGTVIGSTRFQLGPSHFSAMLYRSGDGGQSWTESGNLEKNSYTAVTFVDASHGWVLREGTDETLRLTQDGGQTWTAVSLPHAPHAAKMRFINANRGWMVGQDGSAMMTTADGGRTWKSQFTSQASWVNLLDLSFPDEHNGYVVTDNGVIGTVTGGNTWRAMLTGVTGLTSISFPDSSHGWVVGKGGYINHYHIVAVAGK